MNKDRIYQGLKKFVRDNTDKDSSHNYSHALRVANLCKSIAIKEGYRAPFLAEITGLLHDIAMNKVSKAEHAVLGADMVGEYLRNQHVFSGNDIKEVQYAIKYHNRKRLAPRDSFLLNILVDADTLDLLGAVGLLRGIRDNSHKPIGDFGVKIENQGSSSFNGSTDCGSRGTNTLIKQILWQISCSEIIETTAAKSIAGNRVNFLMQFIKNLESELKWES